MVKGLGVIIVEDLIPQKTTNAYNVVVNGNDMVTISEALGPSHFHLRVSDMVVMSTVLFLFFIYTHNESNRKRKDQGLYPETWRSSKDCGARR